MKSNDGASPGIEPGTSRTRSENHTTRPRGHSNQIKPHTNYQPSYYTQDDGTHETDETDVTEATDATYGTTYVNIPINYHSPFLGGSLLAHCYTRPTGRRRAVYDMVTEHDYRLLFDANIGRSRDRGRLENLFF